MTRYSHDPGANRWPPSCGTCPVAFSRTRLRSGSSTFTRRPWAPRVSASKSRAGSWPKRLRFSPPRPWNDPWQLPALQPSRPNRLATCRSNSTAGSTDPSGSRTGSTPPPHDGRAPSIARSPTAAATTTSHRPAPSGALRLQHEGHLFGLPLGERELPARRLEAVGRDRDVHLAGRAACWDVR